MKRKYKQEVRESEWLAVPVKRRALIAPRGERRGGEDDGDDRSGEESHDNHQSWHKEGP